MPRAVGLLALILSLAPGCSRQGERPPPVATAGDPGCKPVAPVALTARVVAVAGGLHELEVEAEPTTDVDRVELTVVAPAGVSVVGSDRARFAATRQGITRSARFRVRVDGPGAVVPVSARVALAPGIEPNEVVELTLGTPPAPPPRTVRTLALPGGLAVDEVMP